MSCSGSRVFNSVSPDVYTGILAGGLGIDYAYLSFPTKFPGTSPKSNGVLVRKAGVDGIMPSRAKEFYEATLNEGLFSHMTNLVLSHVWDSTSKVKKLLPSLDIALDGEAFYNAAIKEILAKSRVLLEEDVRFLASVTPKNENDIRDHITSLFEARVKRERQRKVRKALTFSKLRKRVWGKPKEESTSNRFHVDEWVENDSVQDIHDACMYLYRKFSPLPPVGAKVEDVLGLKT
jgi:hypothetical protein